MRWRATLRRAELLRTGEHASKLGVVDVDDRLLPFGAVLDEGRLPRSAASVVAASTPLLLALLPTSPGQDPWYGRDIKAIREQWDSRVRRDLVDLDSAPLVYVANDVTGESGTLNSVDFGLAWIYGDVVQHDRNRRNESHIFGLRERFIAAVPLVAFTMLQTIMLLDTIQKLH